jgi:hypothetical protein
MREVSLSRSWEMVFRMITTKTLPNSKDVAKHDELAVLCFTYYRLRDIDIRIYISC